MAMLMRKPTLKNEVEPHEQPDRIELLLKGIPFKDGEPVQDDQPVQKKLAA